MLLSDRISYLVIHCSDSQDDKNYNAKNIHGLHLKFGWNGIGKEIVDSLNKMDLPVIMGSVLLIALLFVVINILVDLIYGWLDPRVRI